ncbi:MAG: ABC transporter ATP-binding protein [Proteobacteria bacterium]|nr:ABC transporter ATP-binding protein [Pseudomonadota bacterium]MBU4470155.1 ABC transporter ATP-binding protein [Pseudomonadota bacterium]MCG2753138.1 ABC transporter ATP-binding protein [Desulfobacteraceae bacterium]
MNHVDPVVEIKGLTKRFGRKAAITSITMEILPGRIIGLLGPNGCGKSTLIRHMIGLYLASEGSCVTLGCNAANLGAKEFSRIGYVHQEGKLLDWMTVKQQIRYVGAYYPCWNKDLEERFVEDFEISLKDRVGALSPGQRQKLAILLAIGHEPDLLILDEPAGALDPIARSQFLDLLLKLIQKEGRTILISSHILSDAEKVIDHVIMMKQGNIIEDRSFDDLQERYLRIRLTTLGPPLPETLGFENTLSCIRNNGQAVLTLEEPDFEKIKSRAERLKCRMDTQRIPLEDLYKIIMDKPEKGGITL